MKTSRAREFGRHYGQFLNYIIQTIPQNQRNFYKAKLISELEKYSFEPRKQGHPENTGCVKELEGLLDLNPQNPEHTARLVKEMAHLMYQKQTTKRIFENMIQQLKLR
jgi:hypothetical protein